MRKTKRTTRRGERGSIYIELIFLMPVIILIWTLLAFIFEAKTVAVNMQQEARECGWSYAMNQCNGGISGACQGGGTSDLDDGEIRALAVGAFSVLSGSVPGTSQNYGAVHGRAFDVTAEQVVNRPAVLGGSTTARGRFATACADDPPKKWTTDDIFSIVCVVHGAPGFCL